MCCKKDRGCQHPENGREPGECTPEQIQKCHGDVAVHPCDAEASES